MSYNVISEAPGRLDWNQVLSIASELRGVVEVFPIPAESPEDPDALGLSIPSKRADERAWQELTRLIDSLKKRFEMKAVELYSGLPFEPATLERIRKNFLE